MKYLSGYLLIIFFCFFSCSSESVDKSEALNTDPAGFDGLEKICTFVGVVGNYAKIKIEIDNYEGKVNELLESFNLSYKDKVLYRGCNTSYGEDRKEHDITVHDYDTFGEVDANELQIESCESDLDNDRSKDLVAEYLTIKEYNVVENEPILVYPNGEDCGSESVTSYSGTLKLEYTVPNVVDETTEE